MEKDFSTNSSSSFEILIWTAGKGAKWDSICWDMRQVSSKRDYSRLEANFTLLSITILARASLSPLKCTGYSRTFRDFMQDCHLFLKQRGPSSRGQGAVHTNMPCIQVCTNKEGAQILTLDSCLPTSVVFIRTQSTIFCIDLMTTGLYPAKTVYWKF